MVSTVLDLVSAPGVLYATVLVLLTVDAFIPVVPAQALMIGGGILSSSGHVQLLLLVLSGAAGVIAGDLLAFLVGRRLARRGERRPSRLPRRAAKITARLNDAMQRHIFLAVLFCRFVPAGRMITAVYAGRNGVSTRRFASYDVVAAVLWASYGALLGHFGGEAIADSSWLPLLLIAAAALLFVAGAPLLGLAARLWKRHAASAAAARDAADVVVVDVVAVEALGAAEPRRARICRRRTAMETLAAVEPLAAIEVMVAAEAVAAAESVVVEVNGLESAAQ
ncbi:DedA family protein [Dactylosporangium sp. NPDC051541]|uniref:DedA family protein n=1 Tax=Dactylosporangium sp. NPDC051541 TaxID=3363977 RepID=UPI0037B1BFB8